MKKILRKIFKKEKINPKELEFEKEFNQFYELCQEQRTDMPVSREDIYACLDDKTASTPFGTNYVYHTGWAARKLKQINPTKHIDISSSIYFVAIASAVCPIDFYDYRPVKLNFPEVTAAFADLNNLPFETESVESISCMHVIEHIGLARYGDKMDPIGDIRAINELKRVTKKGGSILFVVPVNNTPLVQFNAHRIYSYEQIVEYFGDDFELREYSVIPRDEVAKEKGMIFNAPPEVLNDEKLGYKHGNYGYANGCFWFVRK